jgi:hypothetical protein
MDQPHGMIDCGLSPVPNSGGFWTPGLASPRNCARQSHRRSKHRNEFALGIGVAIDVALRGLDRPVTGQQLHVP